MLGFFVEILILFGRWVGHHLYLNNRCLWTAVQEDLFLPDTLPLLKGADQGQLQLHWDFFRSLAQLPRWSGQVSSLQCWLSFECSCERRFAPWVQLHTF